MYEAVVGAVRMQATFRGGRRPFAPGSLMIM